MLTREQIEEVRRRGIDYHTTDWFAKLVNGTCDLALEALSAREPNPPVIPDSSQPVERSEVCGYCKGLKQLHYGEGKDNCHVCQGTGRKPKEQSEVCETCNGKLMYGYDRLLICQECHDKPQAKERGKRHHAINVDV